MKTFKDLKFKPHSFMDGVHAIMHFPNMYGISVVRFKGSYGYSKGLWEAAVLYDGKITYNTEITDYVIGWMSEEDINKVMKQIQEL